MIKLLEFITDATNVYRTKCFIVKQNIEVQFDDQENNSIISRDTFYLRTKQRDKEYEYIFSERKNVNGKRLPSTMYVRIYKK